MNLFMGLLTDPFVAGRGAGPTPGASAPTGYASTQNIDAARDAYAMFTKAPLAQTYDPRWSVWAAGYGGSQTTDGNACARLQHRDLEHLRHRGRRRLSHLAVHGCGFCAGWRRHQFQCRGERHRAFRPVPGRRIHPAHGWRGLCLGRTRLWLAGHHHQSHRDCGRVRSTPRAVRCQCVLRDVSKAAIVLSRPGSAASASRLTPPRSSRPSICLLMPSRRLSAPTRSR